MRLTTDDIAIIEHVARHRLLRSTHLARLVPHRSYKKLLQRLTALYHNGYLDRPRAQLDAYATGGSAPMVYALGPRGAEVLANDGVVTVDWHDKNRDLGRMFIDHALLVADVMVALTASLGHHVGVELVDEASIRDSRPVPTTTPPRKLTASISHDGRRLDLVAIPDALFGLDFTVERKRKYFFLEADCATMPVMRHSLTQSSYARKLMAYLAGGGKANAFGDQLGISNFRLLTVTTSAERIATMVEALGSLTGGNGSAQFLFTDRSSLLGTQDLLSLPWISGKGDRVRLMD